MRPKFRVQLILLTVLGVVFGCKSVYGTGSGKFNVLLVTVDTLRPDRLSCYSGKYLQTPQIDALAGRGVIFSRAFAHNPMTLPSHANILLGTTALYHGVHENSKSRVSEGLLTLAEYLKALGYSTGAFVGAFPLDSRFGLNQGFDVYDDFYPSKSALEFTYAERCAGKVVDAAIKWLEGQKSRWFIWVHLWDPHSPYLPPEPFNTKFKDDPYSGEVAYVDSELGRLFNHLEKNDLGKSTLAILTGDHGEALGEHGELTHSYFAYNSTLWVPLIIAAPGLISGRVQEYVCHVDIFPTVCEILGAKLPVFLQGISLVPLMKGKKVAQRKIYFESLDAYYNRGWAPLRGLIEGKMKFIESPIPEFYNLEEDFGEERNLASGMELGESRKKLKEMENKLSSNLTSKASQKVDRETQEKLKSLGYLASPVAQTKEIYGPEDDLKTLHPFEQKIDRAIALNDRSEYAESIKLLKEIIQERKDFAKAYGQLSHIYRSQGRDEEAVKVMEEGYINNPKNYAVISSYGILLIKTGKFEKGIELLQEALSLYDLDPDVWNYLGVACWSRGDYEEALKHYQKALSLDSADAVIFNNLGALYLSMFLKTKEQEILGQSIDYFKKAVELDPDLASAHNGLGGAYRMSGNRDEAISCWEKSLELNPNYDFSIYNLGVAYLEKGEKTKALECLEKYRSLKNNALSPAEKREIETLIQKCK